MNRVVDKNTTPPNPYEPPQEFCFPAQPTEPSESNQTGFVFGFLSTIVFSACGVAFLRLRRIPFLNAIIETQAWLLVLFASISVLLIVLVGKNSRLAYVSTSACVIAGWIVIVSWAILTWNYWQSGVIDEYLTFYLRASRHYGVWRWLFAIAVMGFVPALLGLSRVRRSIMLFIPLLLLSGLIATIYTGHTTLVEYILFLR